VNKNQKESSSDSSKPGLPHINIRFQSPIDELRIELTRKSLHLLILFCIPLLDISPMLPVLALIAGMLLYSVSEILRHRGFNVPIISSITERAARRRDSNRFVWGPITLALGATFSLLILILFKPKWLYSRSALATASRAWWVSLSVAFRCRFRRKVGRRIDIVFRHSLACRLSAYRSLYTIYDHCIGNDLCGILAYKGLGQYSYSGCCGNNCFSGTLISATNLV